MQSKYDQLQIDCEKKLAAEKITERENKIQELTYKSDYWESKYEKLYLDYLENKKFKLVPNLIAPSNLLDQMEFKMLNMPNDVYSLLHCFSYSFIAEYRNIIEESDKRKLVKNLKATLIDYFSKYPSSKLKELELNEKEAEEYITKSNLLNEEPSLIDVLLLADYFQVEIVIADTSSQPPKCLQKPENNNYEKRIFLVRYERIHQQYNYNLMVGAQEHDIYGLFYTKDSQLMQIFSNLIENMSQ